MHNQPTTLEDKKVETAALPYHHNAALYEVNTRQFSKEGTFVRVTEQLERIKNMGIDIIWVMPIHPIGKVNRKGVLGSPYSIADYKAVNPAFGAVEDLKALIKKAHELGLKVIIDWVANHTAFDNVWAEKHLDYYTLKDGKQVVALDPQGNATDWTDVADLNYENKEMRAAMIDAMKYWVNACDIDGFRCDMAGFVPIDFWVEARKEIGMVKEGLFWLAEWDEPKMHQAFHMTYGWAPHHLFNAIAQGNEATGKLKEYIEKQNSEFPYNAYRLFFTTNHDENSWNGTIEERMGKNGDAMTVVAFTISGMPLIYNGQENSLNKRLAFFEKDEIDWTQPSKADFFKTLLELKKENKSLWNGAFGGPTEFFLTTDKQLGYTRHKDDDTVLVLANFDNNQVEIRVNVNLSIMTNAFDGSTADFSKAQNIMLPAHGYLVFKKNRIRNIYVG